MEEPMTIQEMELKRHQAWIDYCKRTEKDPGDNTLYFIWISAWTEALVASGEWEF
jgi:hypothetical protein